MGAAKKLLSAKTAASSPKAKKAESPRAAGNPTHSSSNSNNNSTEKVKDSSSTHPHSHRAPATTTLDESDSFFNSYQNNPIYHSNSNSSSRDLKMGESEEEEGEGSDDEEGGPRIRPFRLYRMTWTEWFWTMWTSPSLADCWRIFREFRYAEDHTSSPHDGAGRTAGSANDESDPSREGWYNITLTMSEASFVPCMCVAIFGSLLLFIV